MIQNNQYEAIVVGGGPAGTTAAALLAEKGRRVLLLEKESMPRYHVGESLMPFCYFTLERLGVLPKMKEMGFVDKLSVQFVNPDGGVSQPFYFFQHNDAPSSYTWQVERADFDKMLWDNAGEKGAETRDSTKVVQILREDDKAVGVEAETADGQRVRFHAPVVIDCTGRDAFVAAKSGWRVRDPELNKVSVWTYFKGAKRDEGLAAGSTTVAYLPDKGWFWYIPLRNDIVSVGIVAERDYLFTDTRDPAEIMAREIKNNAWIKDHLSVGEQFGEYWVTGEYSYRSKYCAGDGVVLAGDAFGFLDPVFSSGVFLALKSGEMVADEVDAALTAGDLSGQRFEKYGQELCGHIETMRKIVYAFYDENFSFGKVIKNYPEVQGAITDCLIGDVSTPFDEMFRRMGEFATLPPEVPEGRAAAPVKIS